jgi:hypothetical protein
MKMSASSPNPYRSSWNRKDKQIAQILNVLMLGAALLISAVPMRASNLLLNPGFELNTGHTIPLNWTRFAPPTAQAAGNYWVEAVVTPHSGSLYYKEWGACYDGTNNVAGIEQDFGSAPGSTYQASGWFYSQDTSSGDYLAPNFTWIEVSFLGSGGNLLALYKSAIFSPTNMPTDTWVQLTVTNACNPSIPVSLGDPYFTTYAVTGSVSQLVAPAGTATVRFRFCYLQYLSSQGACYFDDAVLNQLSGPPPPVIGSMWPLDAIFVNPSDGLAFNVTSSSGTINNSSVGVRVNGTDVSSSLVISGTASSKNVSYSGLQSNMTYSVSITATDSLNLVTSATNYFETTWVGTPPVLYLWEAEDFDFNSGMFIDNPVICTNSGNANCYYDKVGTPGVDEQGSGSPLYHLYRPSDFMGTVQAGDLFRKDHVVAGANDYRIDPFNGGDWLNYTHTWPAGSYWVVGRLSTDIGLAGTLTLSTVNPDTTTTDLGTFTITSGRGWTAFDYVLLKDTNGNNAVVTLNGKSTLRVTSGGNLLPNFFALVAGIVDLPTLSNVYPTGTHPFEPTNTFSFTLTTVGANFPAGSIKVMLDGNDVTSALQITGSSSVSHVVYPTLMLNAVHTAVIMATNNLGHGISVTNNFDTFSQANYMVETEDFDYGGGQYITPWTPDAYSALGATTNIDFQHTTLAGESFAYRADGIPEATTHDFQRDVFVSSFGIDYDLTYFAPADWANYTRSYPAGNFYVYTRASGSGPYTMFLDKVVSGAGTVNQVTSRLGQWSTVGRDYVTYSWTPLTDAGMVAPAVVTLGGVSTLRITTEGSTNPNFFMLVPAAGIKIGATHSGNNIQVYFPTQAGSTYRVFYRNSLKATNTWSLLTLVPGDGTVKSVSDPTSNSPRFYKVSSP